jgi:hypothetical protein
MKVALKEDLTGMGGRGDASQERSTRKKMMTMVEWGKQLLSLSFSFIPSREIAGPS